jgi:hypothetical protein
MNDMQCDISVKRRPARRKSAIIRLKPINTEPRALNFQNPIA